MNMDDSTDALLGEPTTQQKPIDSSVKPIPNPPEKSTPTTSSSPYLPVFAKRPPLKGSDIPIDCTSAAYQLFLAHVPDYHQRICTCKQPARSPDVKIVQCVNPACPIRWHHFTCLDAGQKKQAHHASLLCSICRNDKVFDQMHHEHSDLSALANETRRQCIAGFSTAMKTDLCTGDSGPAYPYGLGVPRVEISAAHGTGATEARPNCLGNLSAYGYQDSAPFALVEAYHNAGAYVKEVEEYVERGEEEESEEWVECGGYVWEEGDGDEDGCGDGDGYEDDA